ncbi:MAG TPA: hypothetical protein VGC66_13665 [Pyrinomonadaceae bacterium]
MEREKEIAKLVNVLRRTSRMALHSEWTGGKEDAARFCVEQYNRVHARLKEIDQSVGTVFQPLPQDSSLMVAAMACRQLAAYYEDEVGEAPRWGKAYGMRFDHETFKEFWQKSAREIEDLGEYIRESIEEWVRQRKRKPEANSGAEQHAGEKS